VAPQCDFCFIKYCKVAGPDLPVDQAVKFELVVNLTTAKPLALLSRKRSYCEPTS